MPPGAVSVDVGGVGPGGGTHQAVAMAALY
jgi:hypothetical protein